MQSGRPLVQATEIAFTWLSLRRKKKQRMFARFPTNICKERQKKCLLVSVILRNGCIFCVLFKVLI